MPLNWASSLDQLWQTPGLASALAIGAVLFFAIVLIVVAIRANKTVANGALVVIALASTASMAVMQFRGAPSTDTPVTSRSAAPALSVAALACLDGMAGNGVEAACERTLFSSPDMAAAAVSYTAAQLSRLTPADALTSRTQTVEGTTLRRTLERDRFGLVAQVLMVRDGCTPSACPVFKIFSDSSRVVSNMNDRTYESTIGRYALAWAGAGTAASSTPPPPTPNVAATAAVPPATTAATPARPSTVDFPSAASTPPVNIMIGEVPSSPTLPPVRPAAAPASNPQPKQAPKKQAARQKAAPVQLAPQADGDDEN